MVSYIAGMLSMIFTLVQLGALDKVIALGVVDAVEKELAEKILREEHQYTKENKEKVMIFCKSTRELLHK